MVCYEVFLDRERWGAHVPGDREQNRATGSRSPFLKSEPGFGQQLAAKSAEMVDNCQHVSEKLGASETDSRQYFQDELKHGV